jgi:Tfp pilus assembly protein PilV
MKSPDQKLNASVRNEAGFTMIEAVIAMLVTVVGLVSIAGMFTLAMKTNASSRNFTTATIFAQDKLSAPYHFSGSSILRE